MARRVRVRRLLLFLVLFASFDAPASAAVRYRFDNWTVDQGLPQNIVTAIHQTKDGYLWIATLDGLARFDGVRFTVFDKNNTPGINTHRFTTLFQDAAGDLWLGTESGNVTRYQRGRFTSWATNQGSPIEGFIQDDHGRLLVVSNAITRFDPDGDRFVDIGAPRFASGYHRLRWQERQGFWSTDDTTLHCFDGSRWTSYPLPRDLPGASIANAAQAQDGSLWLETTSGRHLRLRDAPGVPASEQTSRVAYRDVHGNVWSMTIGRDLIRTLTLATQDGPASVEFTVLVEDREGHLWLGTNGRGLHRVRPQPIVSYSQPQGLVDRNVYPVFEDRTGDIWIGGWTGGLSRWHQGRFTSYTTRDGLKPGSITALAEDRDGQIWIAIGGQLQVWRDGRFTDVSVDVLPPGGTINVIHQDAAGVRWFGTDQGLVRDEGGGRRLLTVRDGLASDNVRVVIDRAGGGVWIGGYGGLTRLVDGQFTSWPPGEGPRGDMIRALYEDAEGVLWIGTYDGGLGRLHDGVFTRYTTREGLVNNGVFQILEDARGNLWMSSNRGISRVAKRDLNERAAGRLTRVNAVGYGRDDGMLNVECNGGLWPAGVAARDGKLWFPTQGGVAVIDPTAIDVEMHPPRVLIESVLVDRAPVALERAAEDGIRVGPDATGFEIAYTGMNVLNAERVRFRYKLDGLDRAWVDVGTRRTAYYSHLPAGDYTFRVTAANGDGVWSPDTETLRIIVTPPFYQRMWFVLLILTGAAAAEGLWQQRRLARVRAAAAAQQEFSRRLLASQEQERQRIAGELHDSLGQQLVVIRNRAMLGEQSADDPRQSRSQFDEITASAKQAIDEVRAIAHNLRPVNLDRLGLTASIEELVEKLASSSGMQISADVEPLDGRLSKEAEISCYRIIQESTSNIVKHAAATKAYVELWYEDGALQITVRDNGRGMDDATARQARGLGLTSITERVRILGGTLSIEAAPGQGTTLHIRIPA